jgi:hypothetical protein
LPALAEVEGPEGPRPHHFRNEGETHHGTRTKIERNIISETNAKASEAEKEQAYRSGFRHAVAYLLVALNDQVTPDQMSV